LIVERPPSMTAETIGLWSVKSCRWVGAMGHPLRITVEATAASVRN
jgi:hypothetical protein